MEYIYYILVIVAILVSCFLLVRVPARSERKHKRSGRLTGSHDSARLQPAEPKASSAEFNKPASRRKLPKVPTPWGWPGNNGTISASRLSALKAQEVRGVSESLHQFVDRLFKEKHTVEDREYLLRKNASVRALIEDRYGRASTLQDIPNPASKTPPPARSRHQKQTAYGKKANGIAARTNQQRKTGAAGLPDQAALSKSPELKEVRRPWGW